MKADLVFKGNDQEWLTKYCKHKLETNHYDYFVFGHRHLPLDIKLSEVSTYYNLGDWITHFTYCSFDGKQMKLLNH